MVGVGKEPWDGVLNMVISCTVSFMLEEWTTEILKGHQSRWYDTDHICEQNHSRAMRLGSCSEQEMRAVLIYDHHSIALASMKSLWNPLWNLHESPPMKPDSHGNPRLRRWSWTCHRRWNVILWSPGWGFPCHVGTQKWMVFVREDPTKIWMITRGTPYDLGNPHYKTRATY